MKVFKLVRKESATAEIIAEGVVFSNGTYALSKLTETGVEIYSSLNELKGEYPDHAQVAIEWSVHFKKNGWRWFFDEVERKYIEFCCLYDQSWSKSDRDYSIRIIAEMARLMDAFYKSANSDAA